MPIVDPSGSELSSLPGGAGGGGEEGSGNQTENNTEGVPGQGTQRNWRGYVDTDVDELKSKLPTQAQHLAEYFIDAGKKYNIDPLFLVAISRHETGNWTSAAFRDRRQNAMGISGPSGPIGTGSHEESIHRMAASLAGAPGSRGYYNNANTVGEVSAIYALVGASNDPRNLNGYSATSIGKYYDIYVNTLR